MKWGSVLFLVALFAATPTEAAYRVFELRVTPYRAGRAGRPQVVNSTLDPNQYAAYHGNGEYRVEMVSHWYCPGDTSHKAYCPKPKMKKIKEQEASR